MSLSHFAGAAVAAAAVCVVIGCGGRSDLDREAIVAQVGDRPIELRLVTDYITSLQLNFPTDSSALAARRRQLDRLIEEQLFIIGAYSRAMDADIGIIELVDREKDKFLLDELYREEILGKAKVDPREFDDAYSRWFDRVRPMHILLKTKATADSVLAALRAGADFADMAEKHSIDRGTMVRGGDFGREFEWGELMEPVQSAAFSLQEGELSEPFESEFGWHVLKIRSRRRLDEQPVDEVRGVINERLLRLAQERRRLEQLEDIRSRANIRFDADALAFLRAQVQAGRDTLPENAPIQPPLEIDAFPPEKSAVVLARYGTNGEITVDRFARQFNQQPSSARPNVMDSAMVTEFVFQMGLFDLLRDEALRLKLDNAPVYRERLREFQEKLMADKMREKVLAQKLRVTMEDARAFYDAKIDSFVQPPQYHVQEILVGTNNEALKILGEAKSGADFSELSRKYNKRPGFQKTEGDLGWVSKRRYGDLYNTAASLKTGEVGGPVPGVGQYSVIKVLDSRPSSQRPFEDAQNEIFDRLQKQRAETIVNTYIDSMKVIYPVIIHEDVLKQALPESTLKEAGPTRG